MKIIQQNLLDIDYGIICHSTNCQGVMGGLAGDIKKKYPIVFSQYQEYLNNFKNKRSALGTINIVVIKPKELFVLNMFGQFGIGGHNADSMTDYKAFESIAKILSKLPIEKQNLLYMPYLIGCGLGKGDWDIIQDIFKDIDGYFCRL